jgi:hypothetical protein
MKERTLTYLSLSLSIISLAYAAWVHHQGSEVLAMRALRQREAELLRHWGPKMAVVYKDMIPDASAFRRIQRHWRNCSTRLLT